VGRTDGPPRRLRLHHLRGVGDRHGPALAALLLAAVPEAGLEGRADAEADGLEAEGVSRPTLWRCQSCQMPLGTVKEGLLTTYFPSRIGRYTEVRCPVCDQWRRWEGRPSLSERRAC
jgi:hypothetical protein